MERPILAGETEVFDNQEVLEVFEALDQDELAAIGEELQDLDPASLDFEKRKRMEAAIAMAVGAVAALADVYFMNEAGAMPSSEQVNAITITIKAAAGAGAALIGLEKFAEGFQRYMLLRLAKRSPADDQR
jgi:hypothetical protein